MLIAQISDLHLDEGAAPAAGGIDRGARVQRAVELLSRLDPRPDLVVISGDLVDLGTAGEYARLAALVSPLPMPCYLMPGNHDERGRLRQAFPGHRYLGTGPHIQYTVEDRAIRLVMLDSVLPGNAAGELCAQRLAWLDERLAEAPRTPTLLFVHHPPLATGTVQVDRSRLRDAAALGEVVARHPQVERIACGHVHRSMLARWCGTTVSTCPSLVHQFALDLRPDGRLTEVDEGPGFQLHCWRDGSLVTYTAPLS